MCSPKMSPPEHETQDEQQQEQHEEELLSSPSSDTRSSRHVENILVGKPKGLSNESYGLLLLLLSAILFCVMSAFVKLATDTGLPSTEIIFIRAILQGIVIVMGMCWFVDENDNHQNNNDKNDDDDDVTTDRQIRVWEHPFGRAHVRHIVIARGAFGGLAFVLFYYTYSQLPIGDANTLLSLNPVVTAIFAALILGEPMYVSQILAAGLSFVGSLLIARPDFLFGDTDNADTDADNADEDANMTETNLIWGYLSAILGTCLFSAVIILVRKAGTSGVHTLQLMFSWCFFSLVFSSLIGILLPNLSNNNNSMTTNYFYFPNATVWMYILGCLFTGATASFLLNYAGRVAPAGLTAIVRSSTILFSYILQMIVFAEIPSIMTIVGATLILLSLTTIAIQKIHDEKQQSAQKQLDALNKSQQEEPADEENQTHTSKSIDG